MNKLEKIKIQLKIAYGVIPYLKTFFSKTKVISAITAFFITRRGFEKIKNCKLSIP